MFTNTNRENDTNDAQDEKKKKIANRPEEIIGNIRKITILLRRFQINMSEFGCIIIGVRLW